MLVIDASVWVSALVAGDNHHTRSRDFFDRALLQDEALAAPALLLAEVGGAIARRTGSPDAARAAIRQVARLTSLRLLDLDSSLIEIAIEMASERGFRGADAFYVAAAKYLAVPLVTWDRDQASRADGLVAAGPPPA